MRVVITCIIIKGVPLYIAEEVSQSFSPLLFSCSIRIEGDVPGFDVNVSDEKLVTMLSIVTSLGLPPPSLANTTTYYDDIPVRYTLCVK